MQQRRHQRYFQPGPGNEHQDLGENVEVMNQDEMLVMEDDGVAHEEIVDAGDMVLDGGDYNTQGSYQQQLSRRPGSDRNNPSSSNAVDMVSKLQAKTGFNVRFTNGQSNANPTTRITPGGARVVSIPAARKRDANLPSTSYGTKRQQDRAPVPAKDVKVIRLAPSVPKESLSQVEENVMKLEEQIKETADNSKIDLDKIKELQAQPLTNEDYQSLLENVISDLERAVTSQNTMMDFYRQKQRSERALADAREDILNARIRNLENENRKLRDATTQLYVNRFHGYTQQVMVEEDAHIQSGQQEWIVEENVPVEEGEVVVEQEVEQGQQVEEEDQQQQHHQDMVDGDYLQ